MTVCIKDFERALILALITSAILLAETLFMISIHF